eukprot:CFRG0477T1
MGYTDFHEQALSEFRYEKYDSYRKRIEETDGSLEKFSRGYEIMGFHETSEGIYYREWAPGAHKAWLIGDFCNWRRTHEMKKLEFGNWELFLPNNADGSKAIQHMSRVKISFDSKSGQRFDRVPAWIHYAVPQKTTPVYVGVYYMPKKYQFKNKTPNRPKAMRIYEAHVGISSAEPQIASYRYFADNVIPRIARNGYNVIQLMGVMEHAYYGSFGYQVTSFYAVSSRSGEPEDLKYLIDKAHGYGIFMLLDVVHSHASINSEDGLNLFDGTDGCYFHKGERGTHEEWGSRLFNYSQYEVVRFLLSNLRWWVEEYRFDGFRFDGVTSMLYKDHGLGRTFITYNDYFGDLIDSDCVCYLQLANAMLHELYPNHMVTIGEDVSGMPALALPVEMGGEGFDYRLAMGIADKWIDIVEHFKVEQWDMGNIAYTLTNRRHGEKYIAYAESHDQSIVGDQALAFRLMKLKMYTHMSEASPKSSIVERGIAFHKMIRFITYSLGGEGYLNFMGNEFGHPEWIDFPRTGNNESYQYARRQWNLVDNRALKYQYLNNFDVAMHKLCIKYDWLNSPQAYVSLKHEVDKLIVFERAGCMFVFNFNNISYTDYKLGCGLQGKMKIVFSSDDLEFAGLNRLDKSITYVTKDEPWNYRENSIMIPIPGQTCFVLAPH